MPETDPMSVYSVVKLSVVQIPCRYMKEFIIKHDPISVSSVAKPSDSMLPLKCMRGLTLGINPTTVNSVVKRSGAVATFGNTKEFTPKSIPMNVSSVAKCSAVLVPCDITKGLTRERNPLCVNSAVRGSVVPVPSRSIREFTLTEKPCECQQHGEPSRFSICLQIGERTHGEKYYDYKELWWKLQFFQIILNTRKDSHWRKALWMYEICESLYLFQFHLKITKKCIQQKISIKGLWLYFQRSKITLKIDVIHIRVGRGLRLQ